MFSVVIVSAGEGRRYSSPSASLSNPLLGQGRINKTREEIGGVPVFIHSLLLFTDPLYQEIVLVISQIDYSKKCYHQDIEKNAKVIPALKAIQKKIKIISGGIERYHSVDAGLKHCSTNRWVLIHDAARPLLHQNDLGRVSDLLRNSTEPNLGVLPVTRPVNSIKEINDEGFVKKNLIRKNLREASAPQGFPLITLKKVYQYFLKNENSQKDHLPTSFPTDDSEMYHQLGYPVLTMELEYPNPKLTISSDMFYFKQLWNQRLQERLKTTT